MRAAKRLVVFALVGLFRPQASLVAEILVLRHQLIVHRQQSPKTQTLLYHLLGIDMLHLDLIEAAAMNFLSSSPMYWSEKERKLAKLRCRSSTEDVTAINNST
jgi:hypothetical protein